MSLSFRAVLPVFALVVLSWAATATAASSEAFLEVLNHYRQEAGLEDLSPRAALDHVATRRARQLADLGHLERPDLEGLMEHLDRRGLDVRSLEEASLITSGPAVPAEEVVAAWCRFAADSFARFLSEDVTALGVGRASEGETTVYTFLGALPETRAFERTVQALGEPEAIRRQLLERVNEARRDTGVAPLELDSRLVEAAQARADDMAERRYYGHESPAGDDFSQVVARTGYAYSTVAENIARGQESVAEVVDGWLDSPGHRANLLNPTFTDVGFGFAPGTPGSDHAFLWVQLFGRPAPKQSE